MLSMHTCFAYAHVCVCVCMCTCVHTCLPVSLYVHAWAHAFFVCACVHICVHVCMHAGVHMCVCAYMCIYTCMCSCTYAGTCVCICVHVNMCACMCACTCVHVRVHACSTWPVLPVHPCPFPRSAPLGCSELGAGRLGQRALLHPRVLRELRGVPSSPLMAENAIMGKTRVSSGREWVGRQASTGTHGHPRQQGAGGLPPPEVRAGGPTAPRDREGAGGTEGGVPRAGVPCGESQASGRAPSVTSSRRRR